MSSRTTIAAAPPTTAYGEAVRAWSDAAGALMEPWRRLLATPEPCGCEGGAPCRCGPCDCCTPDADVLVHARAGERRVVPLLVRNPGRRPLTVTVDVGPFTPCGPPTGLEVASRVLPDAEVDLRPCESETVLLQLDIGRSQTSSDESKASELEVVRRRQLLREQEQCATLVADVRFGGCGSRAVRVGLVVLPPVCDAYEVRCDCGCC